MRVVLVKCGVFVENEFEMGVFGLVLAFRLFCYF